MIFQKKNIIGSQKKHCKLSEISFPMNKCWDFINIKKNSEDTISNDISKSYLSNIFLSSFKILFDKYDPDNRIVQFCNFMLYDNFHNSYFYRSISSLPNQSIDNDIRNIIIANWYEDFKDRNFWKDYCLDLSDTFSDEFYSHYELILKKTMAIGETKRISLIFQILLIMKALFKNRNNSQIT